MKLFRLLAPLLATVSTAMALPLKLPDPATIKDKVTMTVGEKRIIEFVQKDSVLALPTAVESVHKDVPSLSLECSRNDKFVMLVLKNGFQKILHVRALARLKGRKDYFETSILPIQAGLMDFESWQPEIEEIVLFDFKLSDAKK